MLLLEVSSLQFHYVRLHGYKEVMQPVLNTLQYLFCDSIDTFILLDPLGWFRFILGKLFGYVWTDVSPAFLDQKLAKQKLQQISRQPLSYATDYLHQATLLVN